MEQKRKTISHSFQKWLLILVGAAFMVTTLCLWGIQTRLSRESAIDLIRLNISDVRQDIADASDENLLALTRKIAGEISRRENVTPGDLSTLMAKHGVAEINLIDENGVITVSTYPDFINYHMASGAQSAVFLTLLSGQDSYVQSYQPTSFDATLYRKYGGATLESGGFVQVGYDAERFQMDIDDLVVGATRNRHVGENGFIIIADESGRIVSDPTGNEGKHLSATGLMLDFQKTPSGECFTSEVYGKKCYCMYMDAEGYRAVAVMPTSEAVLSRNVSVGVTAVMEVMVFAALFVMIYILVRRLIVNNLQKINHSLSEISNGHLDTVVDVRSHEEFSSLSDDINTTVNTLKRYISDAEARIDAELAFAKSIQHAALPSVFPPYPNRTDFDIWAGMYTAREVGGDFYDFYLINENTLAFAMADVSGKGIPAAMFMMSAKTLLKSAAESGMDLSEVFEQANENLCEGNDAGMFVTAWMGFLNTDTGRLSFVNAGHNPPLVKRRGGKYEYLKMRAGFPLAGMEGMRYRVQEMQLQPGDEIFLYTDGVTEAVNEREEFYGDDRLLRTLNDLGGVTAADICRGIKDDLDQFRRSAPQFDDITMLSLQYRGGPEVYELTLEAKTENIDQATEFVSAHLEKAGCPMKVQMQISVAIDELFGNIAQYAYPDRDGSVAMKLKISSNPAFAELTLTDDGIPFNPLEKSSPNITLSAEEREIGGLGIFLVRKTMDDVFYEYRNDRNILTVRKYFHGV